MTAIVAIKYRVGDYQGRQLAERCVALLMQGGEDIWTMVVNYRGLRLLLRAGARDVAPIILPNAKGIVAGILFERCETIDRRTSMVETATVNTWCATDAKALIETYWGPYLAILNDSERDRVLILRDPLGARACYFAEMPGVSFMFTDVADWAKLAPLEIDDEYLALFMRHTRIEGARTGLKGVTEAIPGMLYRWERERHGQEMIWAPRPPTRSETMFDFEVARVALRKSAQHAAGAWAHADLPIVHRLSGGFDSSAALACMVHAGAADITCITERPVGVPEGDEFEAAARVAAHCHVPLRGINFDANCSDYRAVRSAPTSAKPSTADLSFASAEMREAFDEEIFYALTTGQGGDQVFSRRPLMDGAADALRDGRPWSELKRILWDAARLSRKPLVDVVKATGAGLLQEQGKLIAQLLDTHTDERDGDTQAALAYQLAHPWLDCIDHRGPTRAFRALNILDLAFYQRPSPATAHAIAAPIFAAQPVVECILRIPPYLMQQGGRERALARAAFADLLPEATLKRTRKGDTTRHFQRGLARNLPYLRELVLDGELVGRGLLDRGALEQDLSAPEGRALFRLTAALVAESWMRRIIDLPPPLRAPL